VSEQYRVLAGRIHRELEELGRVVTRAERALEAARQRPEDQDLYLDSAALNLSSRASQLIDRWKIVAGAQHPAAFLSQRHTSLWYRSLGAGTSQT
jgi:hypothetical protein